MSIKEFSESAKGFTKSPLGIIALFIVLVYGFASIVVGFGQNLSQHIAPLIYFMVLFPVLVFTGFLWLVAKHHNKLYGPSDFKDEKNFMKMLAKTQVSSAASLVAAISKPGGIGELNQVELDELVELVTETSKIKSPEKWKNRILWVDDRPDNNVHERQAFEAQGIQFKLVLSTNEALEVLNQQKFACIISDMGRKEGSKEGYILLDKLRAAGDKTPYVIYAGSNLPEHRKMAREHGALGSTNRAQELFQLVMGAVNNGS